MNYSKQRDEIKNVLVNTTSHPTAEWIYAQVKKSIPHVSLATVYRNLKQMLERKEILSVDCGDNTEHFDFDTQVHAHRKCSSCGAVGDVFLDESQKQYISNLCSDKFNLVYYGECQKCINKGELI